MKTVERRSSAAPAKCVVQVQAYWKDKHRFRDCGQLAGHGPHGWFCPKHAKDAESNGFLATFLEGEG